MDLRLDEVADNPGIRIRWAELYALLRAPARGSHHLQCRIDRLRPGRWRQLRDLAAPGKRGTETRIEDIDLLVAGDGRYSAIRQFVLGGPETPQFLNVCLYRVLFPAGPDCPIDDYGQWFNGPNRLLAFRVPGDFVYCAGSFPIPGRQRLFRTP